MANERKMTRSEERRYQEEFGKLFSGAVAKGQKDMDMVFSGAKSEILSGGERQHRDARQGIADKLDKSYHALKEHHVKMDALQEKITAAKLKPEGSLSRFQRWRLGRNEKKLAGLAQKNEALHAAFADTVKNYENIADVYSAGSIASLRSLAYDLQQSPGARVAKDYMVSKEKMFDLCLHPEKQTILPSVGDVMKERETLSEGTVERITKQTEKEMTAYREQQFHARLRESLHKDPVQHWVTRPSEAPQKTVKDKEIGD